MENMLIAVDDICSYHQIEINFIQSLENFGLIKTTVLKKSICLNIDEVAKLERYIRLSHDLEINLEGLHAVANLLDQINEMQNELQSLHNELNYYKQLH